MKPTKKQIALILLFSVLILSTDIVCAQKSTLKLSRSKKLEILQKANVLYDKSQYVLAATDYEKYLSQDVNPPKVVLNKLADCYWQMRACNNALRVYKLLFPNDKDGANEQQQVRIAELYARYGMYKQASQWLQGVNGYKAKADVYGRKLKLELLKRDSLSWKLGFLDINSPYRDYSPFLLDNTLFFCSNKPLLVKRKISKWDGNCFSHLQRVSLNRVKAEPINTIEPTDFFTKSKNETVTSKSLARLYEGADVRAMQNEVYFMVDKRYISDEDTTSIMVDGLNKIDFNVAGIAIDKNLRVYFSANYSKNKNKINRTRLMEGEYSLNKIINVRALPFGNAKSYSVMLPAVSASGNILVFCSDKPGGKGNLDLYYALRDTIKHKWGAIKTFTGNVNTIGNEVFPSITPDGYLYFSNDSRPGLGGLDIYRILLKDAIEGKGEPKHLSYPVNSSADDFGWTVDATGSNGFFTSDRLNDSDDLYSFNYKPYNKVRVISGSVLDEFTKEPIGDATVFMLNHNTSEVSVARTNKTGKYQFAVNSADKVVVKAMKKGMSNDFLIDDGFKGTTQFEDTITKKMPDLLIDKQPDSEINLAEEKNDSTTFSDEVSEQLNDSTMKTIQNRMFAKQNFKINNSWKLNNIYYDYNKADLREESKPMLDSLITMLKKLPLRVELSSHTDSRGSFEYNDKLSQQRAESVVLYLVKHGIASNRVLAKGFGKRRLLNRCTDGVPCSESEHQLNRRTEVRVMGYSHKDKKYKFDPSKYKQGDVIDKLTLPKDFFDN